MRDKAAVQRGLIHFGSAKILGPTAKIKDSAKR
ncbi:hypothetical protein N181_08505 [Sinorhizobium fredii USDA 205]|nr:hypothetical protein N181_08505 [Sinorhizobium fredii USDA 205]